MTKSHKIVYEALYPVCLEQTKLTRGNVAVADPNIQATITSWYTRNLGFGIQDAYLKAMMELCSITGGKPEMLKALDVARGITVPPLTVIKYDSGYDRDVLGIVTHGTNKWVLHPNGTNVQFINTPIIASDKEVKTCIEKLTSKQLVFILKDSLFAAALSAELEEKPTDKIAI